MDSREKEGEPLVVPGHTVPQGCSRGTVSDGSGTEPTNLDSSLGCVCERGFWNGRLQQARCLQEKDLGMKVETGRWDNVWRLARRVLKAALKWADPLLPGQAGWRPPLGG